MVVFFASIFTTIVVGFGLTDALQCAKAIIAPRLYLLEEIGKLL